MMMWDDVKWFVSAAEAGSFSEAAKQQNVSVTTISRRVEALEHKLGIRLLNRHVSGVNLTAEGKIILISATDAANKMIEVKRMATTLREGVEIEPVVVSSTEPIMSEILAPNLHDFWKHNPKIKLRLSVATANINLARSEADIAIRLARPTQENLMIKRLPVIKQGLFASAQYLNGRDPNSLDLNKESFLGMDRSFGDIPEYLWIIQQNLASQQKLESSSIRTLCNAAREGCGIALLPKFIARLEKLVEIPQPSLPQRSAYLVFHRDFRKVKRIRLVRDWVTASFKKALEQ